MGPFLLLLESAESLHRVPTVVVRYNYRWIFRGPKHIKGKTESILFFSELRSCVKVEVDVLGSRP